jgi:hypothetical protein
MEKDKKSEREEVASSAGLGEKRSFALIMLSQSEY